MSEKEAYGFPVMKDYEDGVTSRHRMTPELLGKLVDLKGHDVFLVLNLGSERYQIYQLRSWDGCRYEFEALLPHPRWGCHGTRQEKG